MTIKVKYLLYSLAYCFCSGLLPVLAPVPGSQLKPFNQIAQAQEQVLTHYNYQVPLGSLKIKADIYAASPELAQQFNQVLIQQTQAAGLSWQDLVRHSSQALLQTTPLKESELKLFQLLKNSCEWSQGAFDITDYPLREIWGFTPDSLAARLPAPAEIKQALKQVSCQKLEIDTLPPGLFLTQKQSRLNLDAVRRGWLIDSILPALKRLEIPAFALKIDDLAYYYGSPPGAQAWKIPWSHPREKQRTFTDLYAKDQALALVGDYQDFFMHNGIRYSSHLDSRSGYPNTKNLAVQVTAPSALSAQIIAQALALLDDNETKAFLSKLQHGVVYKIVDQNGIMYPVKYEAYSGS